MPERRGWFGSCQLPVTPHFQMKNLPLPLLIMTVVLLAGVWDLRLNDGVWLWAINAYVIDLLRKIGPI